MAISESGFPDLRTFVDRLKRDNDLVIVDVPVDPYLEVAEIHRRVIAAGGPALLFTNVTNASFPLVTNLFGTSRRAELAFGARPLQLIKRLVGLTETLFPPTSSKLWEARDVAGSLLRMGTVPTTRGPVTDVIASDVNLEDLPALTCWPDDGGPFITLPLVYTEHPTRSGHNLGMYRMQVHDRRSTGMHWQIGKGGGFHYAAAEAGGQGLPATVFLGGPPALMLAAISPLPENVPELMLASLVAGQRLPVVDHVGRHRLIGTAEFALMGSVAPDIRRSEGPFGDHYGYYSLAHDYPVFSVEKIAHRKDAIYPATVVGKPRQEDFFIGDLLQELLSPLFPLVMPAVVDLWSYGETGYHSLSAAVVRERYAREAMASAFRILGEGQLSLTKFLLVTDQPVDLKNFRETLVHLLERTHPETDLYVFSNLSMDTLDYTGPEVNKGSKGVWLGLGPAVRRLPQEFRSAELPHGVSAVHVFCPGCLVVDAPAYADEPDVGARIAKAGMFKDWPLIVISDEPDRAVSSVINFLWTTFTRFEPAADMYASRTDVVRHHVSYSSPVVIDARMKPWYPAELSCRPDIARKVTERWTQYFPRNVVEMGDSEKASLT
ncbi:MAG: UbiD family decarboxylase [Acidobacteriota bacterium]|nr:UbiD family decarboxylase [Acidobacteriota bacterium]